MVVLRLGARLTFVAALLAALWGCIAERSGSNLQDDEHESTPETYGDESEDVTAYAALCKAELGITAPLPDLNCTAGVPVPITVDGAALTAESFAKLAKGGGCDRAQWLDGACWTYDLVQRVTIPGNDAIEGVLNCRQKLFTNELSPGERKAAYAKAVAARAPKEELLLLWRMIFEFDDLGLILRNKDTGKSCFFTFFGGLDFSSVSQSNSFYGGWIPGPDKKDIPRKEAIFTQLPEPKPPSDYPEYMWNRGPEGGKRGGTQVTNMFFTPRATDGGGCVSCHGQGAFKHSPFIDQARDDKGRIVPKNDPNVPYLPVGALFQASFRKAEHIQVDTIPIPLKEGEEAQPQICTGCHAIVGGSMGNHQRLLWAIGRDVPKPSAGHSDWRLHAWMKPAHGKKTQDEYNAAYGPHIDALLCCLQKPIALGCRYRTFGPTLSEVKRGLGEGLDDEAWADGTGPETCAVKL